jgi:hypothetical protein
MEPAGISEEEQGESEHPIGWNFTLMEPGGSLILIRTSF